MKKWITYLFTAILAASVMTGCSSGGGSNSTAAPAGTEAAKPSESESEAPAASEVSEPSNRLENILASGKLTISTSPDFAPYEFIDLSKSGQDSIVGSDIEFAKYIAEQLGVELVIEAMNFDAALAAVTEGKVDLVISGLAYKADRAEAMMLTEYFNLGSDQGIMVLTSELENYKAAEDFAGKTIGAQNASLQYDNVVNQLPDAIVETVATVSDGILMLQNGKIDALAMSGTTGDQYALNYEDIAMSEFKFETDSDGNVIGIRNGEEELYDRINEIIADVNEQNLYEQWKEDAQALSKSLVE